MEYQYYPNQNQYDCPRSSNNSIFIPEPKCNFVKKYNYLSIDSRDRDRTSYPNPNSYRIPFNPVEGTSGSLGKVYKNVIEISLVSVLVPNIATIENKQYIILEIDELKNLMFSSSTEALKYGFAKLHFHTPSTGCAYMDVDNSTPLTYTFYQSPIATLSSLTVRYKEYNGNLINFGVDTSPPDPCTDAIQNSLTFKVVESVANVDSLQQFNVY